MAFAIQLDLFQEYDEFAIMKLELHKMRAAQDNLRRGLFARHGDMAKQVLALYDEIEQLRMEIAKLKRGIK